MPYKPLRPCTHTGCPALVADGSKCPKHKITSVQAYDRYRGNARSRGYDAAWEKVRAEALERDGYICQHCLKKGYVTPGKHVDHIIPFHVKNDPLRLALDNLQTLCQPCHNKKTGLDSITGNRKYAQRFRT